MSDKRAHKRLQMKYPLLCHRQKSETLFFIVFDNISEGGMKICPKDTLEENERIGFDTKILGNIIKGEGKIVWYKPALNGGYNSAGVKFTKIEPIIKKNLSKCLLELTTA